MQHRTSVRISSPVGAVWDVLVDVERWPEWTASVRSARRLDAGPLQLGSKGRISQPRLRKATWTVDELRPQESFRWTNRSPGLVSRAEHEVRDDGSGGAEVVLTLTQDGPLAVLALPFRGLTQRYVQMEAAGLKARVER